MDAKSPRVASSGCVGVREVARMTDLGKWFRVLVVAGTLLSAGCGGSGGGNTQPASASSDGGSTLDAGGATDAGTVSVNPRDGGNEGVCIWGGSPCPC